MLTPRAILSYLLIYWFCLVIPFSVLFWLVEQNSVSIGGSSDYFGTNCTSIIGNCYKVSVTVTNPCGSYTNYSYIKINGAYAPDHNGGGDARSMPVTEGGISALSVAVYPNPASAQTIFDIQLPKAGNVTLQIFDLTGQMVLSPIINSGYEAGEHQLPVYLNNLAEGTYLYNITTSNGESKTGRLVKLE